MKCFLKVLYMSDDISAGAFPGFQLVITHSGILQINKTPARRKHVGVKGKEVVGSL